MNTEIKKIDLNSVRSEKYDDTVERLGDWGGTCFLCGKRTGEKKYVHYTTFGNLINTNNSDYTDGEDESQGFFPIGNECAKKLPKDFVFLISK